MRSESFRKGVKDGIPIGLGYFAVSFTFGMMAVADGPVSYTHLDVYKRQEFLLVFLPVRLSMRQSSWLRDRRIKEKQS